MFGVPVVCIFRCFRPRFFVLPMPACRRSAAAAAAAAPPPPPPPPPPRLLLPEKLALQVALWPPRPKAFRNFFPHGHVNCDDDCCCCCCCGCPLATLPPALPPPSLWPLWPPPPSPLPPPMPPPTLPLLAWPWPPRADPSGERKRGSSTVTAARVYHQSKRGNSIRRRCDSLRGAPLQKEQENRRLDREW